MGYIKECLGSGVLCDLTQIGEDDFANKERLDGTNIDCLKLAETIKQMQVDIEVLSKSLYELQVKNESLEKAVASLENSIKDGDQTTYYAFKLYQILTTGSKRRLDSGDVKNIFQPYHRKEMHPQTVIRIMDKCAELHKDVKRGAGKKKAVIELVP